MSARLVSVIIPCRNAAPRLEACLASLEAQTHPTLEIIFVDNGSTDDSLAIAERAAGASRFPYRISSCSTPGANHARHAGMDAARGDFIQWLDADDELASDKVAAQVAALEAAPEIAIAHGAWVIESHASRGRRGRVYHPAPDLRDPLFRLLADGWFMAPPLAFMLRREWANRLHAARAWGPSTTVWQDREYFTVAALLGARFVATPGAVAHYHLWSGNQTSAVDPNARVPVARALFDRFRALADAAPAGLVRAHHRRLLDQSWSRFRVDRTNGEAGPRTRALGGAASVVAREVAPLDAARTLEWFTSYVRMRAPSLSSAVLAVRDAMDAFVADGLLVAAEA